MNELSNLDKTMTLKDITDLLEVQHSKAMVTVAKMAKESEFGALAIIDTVYNSKGQTIETYKLDKRQSMAVSAKLNTALLMRVIDRWQELESSNLPAIPKNYAEALQLAADQAKEIEFKDDLIIASNEASIKAGDIKVSEFVKSTDIIDLGRNQFYEWMREQGYLFQNSCEPIQTYVKRGFFKWLPTDEEHGGKMRYTLFITARGKVWLAAKYMKFQDNE